MGIMKQMMLEEAEREAKAREGHCLDCGNELTADERDTGRDECFGCYCDRAPD